MNEKLKWNRKYEDRLSQIKFPTVNDRLKELSVYLEGGSALELACGLGGNSLYLAHHNYEVQALDISEVAINFLKDQAQEKQLSIQAQVCDLTELSILPTEKELVNLVVITYYLDRNLFPLAKSLIKKSGYFFMETFYLSQTTQCNEVSDKYKLRSQELLQEFTDWKILYYEENEQEGRQTIFCQK